jgi:hypothetical protein
MGRITSLKLFKRVEDKWTGILLRTPNGSGFMNLQDQMKLVILRKNPQYTIFPLRGLSARGEISTALLHTTSYLTPM